jgi:thioredoxin reductase
VVLFAEDDRGYDFFVVEEGRGEILEHSAGCASTMKIHEVGEFTCDVDMLTGRASLVTARARGATRVIRVPGVFAVGDVGSRSAKRLASAVGEGSIQTALGARARPGRV